MFHPYKSKARANHANHMPIAKKGYSYKCILFTTRQQRIEGSANAVNVTYITIGYIWTLLLLVMSVIFFVMPVISIWLVRVPKTGLTHYLYKTYSKLRMSCIVTFLCLHNFYFAAKNIEVKYFSISHCFHSYTVQLAN